jgi:hypothetical protein
VTKDEALALMKKRSRGVMSVQSAVQITLRGAYNHPAMQDTPEWQAAKLLSKEFGFTRYGNEKPAKDSDRRAGLHRALDKVMDAAYPCVGCGRKRMVRKGMLCAACRTEKA